MSNTQFLIYLAVYFVAGVPIAYLHAKTTTHMQGRYIAWEADGEDRAELFIFTLIMWPLALFGMIFNTTLYALERHFGPQSKTTWAGREQAKRLYELKMAVGLEMAVGLAPIVAGAVWLMRLLEWI